MMLFGLTTAFLTSMLQRNWPRNREGRLVSGNRAVAAQLVENFGVGHGWRPELVGRISSSGKQ
jgi:hypothetical protein